jgi:hypothetical protein
VAIESLSAKDRFGRHQCSPELVETVARAEDEDRRERQEHERQHHEDEHADAERPRHIEPAHMSHCWNYVLILVKIRPKSVLRSVAHFLCT